MRQTSCRARMRRRSLASTLIGLLRFSCQAGLNNHAAQGFWAEVSRILARDPSLQVVAGEWSISKSSVDWASGTHRRQGFPYARWFRAFDFAVSAAGYNSFSELTRFRTSCSLGPQ